MKLVPSNIAFMTINADIPTTNSFNRNKNAPVISFDETNSEKSVFTGENEDAIYALVKDDFAETIDVQFDLSSIVDDINMNIFSSGFDTIKFNVFSNKYVTINDVNVPSQELNADYSNPNSLFTKYATDADATSADETSEHYNLPQVWSTSPIEHRSIYMNILLSEYFSKVSDNTRLEIRSKADNNVVKTIKPSAVSGKPLEMYLNYDIDTKDSELKFYDYNLYLYGIPELHNVKWSKDGNLPLVDMDIYKKSGDNNTHFTDFPETGIEVNANIPYALCLGVANASDVQKRIKMYRNGYLINSNIQRDSLSKYTSGGNTYYVIPNCSNNGLNTVTYKFDTLDADPNPYYVQRGGTEKGVASVYEVYTNSYVSVAPYDALNVTSYMNNTSTKEEYNKKVKLGFVKSGETFDLTLRNHTATMKYSDYYNMVTITNRTGISKNDCLYDTIDSMKADTSKCIEVDVDSSNLIKFRNYRNLESYDKHIMFYINTELQSLDFGDSESKTSFDISRSSSTNGYRRYKNVINSATYKDKRVDFYPKFPYMDNYVYNISYSGKHTNDYASNGSSRYNIPLVRNDYPIKTPYINDFYSSVDIMIDASVTLTKCSDFDYVGLCFDSSFVDKLKVSFNIEPRSYPYNNEYYEYNVYQNYHEAGTYDNLDKTPWEIDTRRYKFFYDKNHKPNSADMYTQISLKIEKESYPDDKDLYLYTGLSYMSLTFKKFIKLKDIFNIDNATDNMWYITENEIIKPVDPIRDYTFYLDFNCIFDGPDMTISSESTNGNYNHTVYKVSTSLTTYPIIFRYIDEFDIPETVSVYTTPKNEGTGGFEEMCQPLQMVLGSLEQDHIIVLSPDVSAYYFEKQGRSTNINPNPGTGGGGAGGDDDIDRPVAPEERNT